MRRQSAVCHHSHCRYEPIDDLSTLRLADHITWHRPYLIWHHALVTGQDVHGRQVTINEYTVSDDGPYAAIVETKLTYDEFVLTCRSHLVGISIIMAMSLLYFALGIDK